MWVIDNFLPDSLHQDLKNLILGQDVDWTYCPGATSVDTPNEFYFVHKVIAPDYTSSLFKDISRYDFSKSEL